MVHGEDRQERFNSEHVMKSPSPVMNVSVVRCNDDEFDELVSRYSNCWPYSFDMSRDPLGAKKIGEADCSKSIKWTGCNYFKTGDKGKNFA